MRGEQKKKRIALHMIRATATATWRLLYTTSTSCGVRCTRQTKGRERTRCFFSPYTVLSLLLFIFISAFDSFFPFLFAVVFNSLLPMNGVLLSVGIFGAIKEGNKSRWFLQPPPVAKAEKHLPSSYRYYKQLTILVPNCLLAFVYSDWPSIHQQIVGWR